MKRLIADLLATTFISLVVAAPIVWMVVTWPYCGIASLISLVAYIAIWEWLRDYIGLPLPERKTQE